jgi:hypothetical protein
MRFLLMATACTLSLCYTTTSSFAGVMITPKPKPKNNYIEHYLPIASTEKVRSTIPIAIIIGQGIFESGWGEASLATDANNHFGIKCGQYWNGPSYLHKDDDLDAEGNLIESCFRLYESAEHSYIDHTDFLMSNTRYEPLFAIQNNDYRKWAYGLQKAGYATDTAYAKKLIGIIERYELYKYDGLNGKIVEEIDPAAMLKTIATTPLGEEEMFEIESGKITKEQNVASIKVEEYEAPKAYQLPKGYLPINRKKFDDFFKRIKNSVSNHEEKPSEQLDEITPQKDEFQARSVNNEKKFTIVRERKIN